MPAEPITAFSWGYWGWGTAVPRFLEAAASAEAARGFQPPAFADVRFNRSVRAPGFRDGALEALVGSDRYRWFKGLGNANIGTGTRVRISQPADAELLLDFVLQQAAAKRRVLFFCACKVAQPPTCHRFEVTALLLEAARARRTRLTAVEWPGGSPEYREIRLRPSSVKGNGRMTVPLGRVFPKNGLATLPWGSQVRVQFGRDTEHVLTAQRRSRDSGRCQFFQPRMPTIRPNAGRRGRASKYGPPTAAMSSVPGIHGTGRAPDDESPLGE